MVEYTEHFSRDVQEIKVPTFHPSVHFEWFAFSELKNKITKSLDLQKQLTYKSFLSRQLFDERKHICLCCTNGLLVLSACGGHGQQWFSWSQEDHGVKLLMCGLCLCWQWYLVSSCALMVGAVIFIQMMLAWEKSTGFLLKRFHGVPVTH